MAINAHLKSIVCGLLFICIQAGDNKPTLEIKDHQAIFARGGVEIRKVPLKPKRIVNQRPDNPNEYFEDRAFLVASCLIVMRDVHCLGDFCHVPGVKAVEVYTPDGRQKTYRDQEITPLFNGSSFTAPSGNWAVVLFAPEGFVSAFLLLRSDGTLERRLIEENLVWGGGVEKVQFTQAGELVFPDMELMGTRATLAIRSDGSFVLR
jgi:hypothetical protein